MMRHVAKLKNTDERCVVAFMQIPGRADHALVIPTDTLPPRFEQAVMDVLKTPEGQDEETFALALSRRLMPDTGKDILATLHAHAMLRAVPCANVIMLPFPNQPIRLVEVLEQLGRLHVNQAEREKFNPYTGNMTADTVEQKHGLGRNLLIEAEMLEAEAGRKRAQAYAYDPGLKPKSKIAPYQEQETTGTLSQSDTLTELLENH